ncbi:MAG: serine hydrolase [bacterium]
MKRWGMILVCATLAVLPVQAGADTVPVAHEVLEAAAQLNFRLPAMVPADLVDQAKASRPVPAAPAEMAPWPTQDWAESLPEEQGMDTPLLTDAFRYAFRNGAKGVVVIRNGYLVAEHYGPSWGPTTREQAYSVSKSFTSALIGMLIDDGVITGTDQPVADLVPEWQDPQHGAVTIGHLLSMDSGLEYNILTDPGLVISRDQNAYALGLPMQHTPGTVWVYHNAACQVPSEVILDATGRQAVVFAAERLGREIGMWNTRWESDRAGNTLTYMGVISSARELAKFGYLFLRQGEWDGRQLISAGYVAAATSPSQPMNPFYGYLWWLNTGGLAMPDVPADAYAALGLNEKKIYVVPSLDLVAVRLGDASSSWDDNAFLGRVCAAVTGKQGEPAKPMAGAAAGVGLEVGAIPESPVLLGNHPNPFNPRTEIGFALPASGPVRLDVFDAAGRQVRTLLAGDTLAEGTHRVAWDGRDTAGRASAAGVYFYRLETGSGAATGKMVLVE